MVKDKTLDIEGKC